MQKIKIKPLSVNEAWQGKRFKTNKYKAYEKELLLLLKPLKIENRNLKISYEFGFSNPLSDFDNPVKSMTDILQKKYGFNDRYIMEANIKKVIVPKGEEYIFFKIEYL